MTEFCEQQAIAHPMLATRYSTMADLYNRKLWHQLTVAVTEFVGDESGATPEGVTGEALILLYSEFIAKFENKINQLRFAQIVTRIARKYEDPAQSVALLQSVLGKEARLGPEAALLLRCELGLTNLRRGVLDGLKDQLAKDKVILEDMEAAETVVHSAYWLLASEFHKQMGPPEAFFRTALMYLAYTPLESMPKERQYELATDISLAAITGEGVFNFGEVVSTAAVKVLLGTENQWLGQLLEAFNKGDIDAFTMIVSTHKEAIGAQPALVSRMDFVKKKMALMCLITMIFELPSHEREVPFAAIAARTRLPLDQVEWLVMRAMSLGLIKGVMDEVDQLVHVSWVMPRVLDKEQLEQLCGRLEIWKTAVTKAHRYMEDQTPELFG